MKLNTKELKTISILYVEDDEVIMKQSLALFEKIFKKVYSATNGLDGIKIFEENQDSIDIVVTDINMPKLNGLDMVKKINEIVPSLPVILTTAYTDSKHLLNAIDLNVDKYISKPIQIRELTVSIVNLVAQYRKSKNLESLAKDLYLKTTNNDKKTKVLKSELDIKTAKVNYYETIIDNFVFSLKTDKMGNIEEVSNKFLNFFDYDKKDILSKNINNLRCDSCEDESFQKLMLKAIHTKKTILSTHTFITNENIKVNFNVAMTPIYASSGLVESYTFYLDLVL
ncbi:MAG: response regulator [Campylobacterota bacterium]|nr:response regulator [Campylobacterota bacterium]